MEPEEYEFVTTTNNTANIPLVCILEYEEPLEGFKFVDRESDWSIHNLGNQLEIQRPHHR